MTVQGRVVYFLVVLVMTAAVAWMLQVIQPSIGLTNAFSVVSIPISFAMSVFTVEWAVDWFRQFAAQRAGETESESGHLLLAKRLLSVAPFLMLGSASALLFAVALSSLWDRWTGAQGTALTFGEFYLFHVAAPLVAPVTYLALLWKVRSHQNLDRQKSALRRMARAINRFEDSKPGESAADRDRRYLETLDTACRRAVDALAAAGLQRPSTERDRQLSAVLFLSNSASREFYPVVILPPEDDGLFREKIAAFRPAFLDRDAVAQAYNAIVTRPKSDKDDRKVRAEDFRRQTARAISATGVVFALERPISFYCGPGRHDLIFRGDIVKSLDRAERPAYRQVVGIPLIRCRRKLGVFMLLGDRGAHLYDRDKMYWIVADTLAHMVALGVDVGSLPNSVNPLQLSTPEELQRVEDLVGGLSSEFSTRV